jgi:methylated-DNA-[protein]-cysteine S-methyltransferase
MPDKQPERLLLDRLATPIGEALIVTDENGSLRAFDWTDREASMTRLLRLHYGSLQPLPGTMPDAIRRAVVAYFEGDVGSLADLPWRTGGTDFQRAVWTALTSIAPGETLSYSGLAMRVGRPAAVRAVGMANGSNPISIVVPCHRVIGANGSLTGYGGGLPRKRWLLNHEGAAFREQAA